MTTTTVLLYHQRHTVLLLDSSGSYLTGGYNKVFANSLIAHKGTDNQIIFDFINQDQKHVDITGKTFTLRIIAFDGETLILEKDLVIINATKGQAKLVLTEQELDGIILTQVGFSIEQTDGTGLYEPVYIDDNAGGRGVINIVDSILPKFQPSADILIPDHFTASYITSIISTEAVSNHTFQLELENFTGTIVLEGASDTDGAWYTIETLILVDTALELLNITGFHQYLRFSITETSGTLTKILYR